ncbi:hypothetical protein OIO90_001913 [Microbotryomycetes sp. JL221]|nr:hypothetical protein OIO90_001913 [Microbotryomycetes sp. JL221]
MDTTSCIVRRQAAAPFNAVTFFVDLASFDWLPPSAARAPHTTSALMWNDGFKDEDGAHDNMLPTWSTNAPTGLTPSLFGEGRRSSGFTPSLIGDDAHLHDPATTSNYDYFNFGSSHQVDFEVQPPPTKRNSLTPGNLFAFDAGRTTDDASYGGIYEANDDDVFASFSQRKRAMSSPALLTPGGSLQYFGTTGAFERGPTDMPLELKMMKRLRPGTSMTSSSAGSRTMSSAQSTTLSEESPCSTTSTVLTPPESCAPQLASAGDLLADPLMTKPLPEEVHCLPSLRPSAVVPLVDTTVSLTEVSAPISMPIEPAAQPLPVVAGIIAPQPTYQMFHMPAMHTDMVASQPYMYEIEAQRANGVVVHHNAPKPFRFGTGTDVVLGPSSTRMRPAPLTQGSEEDVKPAITNEDEMESDDDHKPGSAEKAADRRASLERNRLAAVKSRRKKKEKVQTLESAARNQAAKNLSLQSIALSLRDEVMQLRSQLNTHDGCGCEHVVGYLAREQAGGGIPTIDSLAGRVFSIDYSNVPTLGSENDCYEQHYVPEPEIAELIKMAGKRGAGGGARVKREPDAAPVESISAVAEVVTHRPGPRTRRSAASVAQNGSVVLNDINTAPMPAIARFEPTLDPLPSMPQELSNFSADFMVRPTSAPPVTPSWDFSLAAAGDMQESYFVKAT